MPGPKAKISVSLPVDLVADIDRGVRQKRYASRSAAVEQALQRLARAQRDAEIEAFYAGRTADERAEERAWGELGYEAMVATVRAEERRAAFTSRKPRRGA